MTQQVLSRSQRRMEKRQTVFMLSMLLVVGLICFFLGVMVGKSGEQSLVAEEHMPIKQPLTEPQTVPAEPVAGEAAAKPPAAEGPQDPQLTFYDTLPQGQQNGIGSGINLPPEPQDPEPVPQALSKPSAGTVEPLETSEARKPSAAPVVPAPPKPAASQPVVTEPAVAKPTVSQPVASAAGSYIIQVASVKQRQGAEGLRDRMLKKGYAAFVQSADLGGKGTWYRVYAGPYLSKADAERAVSLLKSDRIATSPLVKRR